jgi:hypothetical protein
MVSNVYHHAYLLLRWHPGHRFLQWYLEDEHNARIHQTQREIEETRAGAGAGAGRPPLGPPGVSQASLPGAPVRQDEGGGHSSHRHLGGSGQVQVAPDGPAPLGGGRAGEDPGSEGATQQGSGPSGPPGGPGLTPPPPGPTTQRDLSGLSDAGPTASTSGEAAAGVGPGVPEGAPPPLTVSGGGGGASGQVVGGVLQAVDQQGEEERAVAQEVVAVTMQAAGTRTPGR